MASPPSDWRPHLLDFLPDELTSNLLAEYVGLDAFMSGDTPATSGPSRGSSHTENVNEDTSSVGDVNAKSKSSTEFVGVEGITTAESAQKAFSLNKATREKLRRERLNERFAELGKLLNLRGTNVDKLRVLSEAIHELKSLREETTQLKNTNHRLHLANTMTSEMAVSLLKAQRDGEPTTNKRSAEEAAGDALHPQQAIQQSAPQVTAQAPTFIQADPPAFAVKERPVNKSSPMDVKRRRMESENFQHKFPIAPGKMDAYSSGWQVNNWPQNMNMTMNMWMPASAQDTSQDHLLRPPVA